jgi:glycosyltransferase involved in cell wall biosynthesis
VALELAAMLPGADVLTSFMDPVYRSRLANHRIRTWPLDRVAVARRRYRTFLPLYPLWFEGAGARSYDLVVSSSSAFAKGVRTRNGALHVAYIHAPMRYAWDLDTYLVGSSSGGLVRVGAGVLRPWLRRWDRRTSHRPDVLIANSATVAERIRNFWDRTAEVIHPPVAVESIQQSSRDDGFLLVAARLLRYRRVDLAIGAAKELDRELVVVGDGPELAGLRAAAGSRTRFLGHIARPELIDLFQRCHAYVVPGEEDFGIAPVEAMAAGKPVVAFRAGGARETVVDGTTGVFFDEPTLDSIVDAIRRLDGLTADPAAIRAHAEQFAPSVFRRKIAAVLKRHNVDPALYRSDGDGRA